MENLKYNLDMSSDSKWKFITPGAFAKEKLLYMQEVGRFVSGKHYYTQRDALDSYLIKYTVSGAGILEYCGEIYTVEPGEFFIIDCTKPQKYYTAPKMGHWDVAWVHFNGVTAEAYYEAFLNSNHGLAVARASDETCRELLSGLLELSENYPTESSNDITASALLTELLGRCIVDAAGKEDGTNIPDYVAKAQIYLRENYGESLSLGTIAEKMNVSRFHFQREFTRYMGASPAEYLKMIRLSHAKQLLRGTDMPIIDIASNVGMDYSYFVQVFRKKEGITPLQYRKQWSNV